MSNSGDKVEAISSTDNNSPKIYDDEDMNNTNQNGLLFGSCSDQRNTSHDDSDLASSDCYFWQQQQQIPVPVPLPVDTGLTSKYESVDTVRNQIQHHLQQRQATIGGEEDEEHYNDNDNDNTQQQQHQQQQQDVMEITLSESSLSSAQSTKLNDDQQGQRNEHRKSSLGLLLGEDIPNTSSHAGTYKEFEFESTTYNSIGIDSIHAQPNQSLHSRLFTNGNSTTSNTRNDYYIESNPFDSPPLPPSIVRSPRHTTDTTSSINNNNNNNDHTSIDTRSISSPPPLSYSGLRYSDDFYDDDDVDDDQIDHPNFNSNNNVTVTSNFQTSNIYEQRIRPLHHPRTLSEGSGRDGIINVHRPPRDPSSARGGGGGVITITNGRVGIGTAGPKSTATELYINNDYNSTTAHHTFGTTTTNHHRQRSTGTASLVSALTESDVETTTGVLQQPPFSTSVAMIDRNPLIEIDFSPIGTNAPSLYDNDNNNHHNHRGHRQSLSDHIPLPTTNLSRLPLSADASRFGSRTGLLTTASQSSDVPESIRQPILNHNDNFDDDHVTKQKILPGSNLNNVQTVRDTHTERPSVSKSIEKLLLQKQDKMHDSLNNRHSLLSRLVDIDDSDDDEDHTITIKRQHKRLTKICEFETEAEHLLLEAIENELNAKSNVDFKNDVLPGIPDDIISNYSRSSKSPIRNKTGAITAPTPSKLTTARLQWLACQQALQNNSDNNKNNSFIRPNTHKDMTNRIQQGEIADDTDTFLRSISDMMSHAGHRQTNVSILKGDGKNTKEGVKERRRTSSPPQPQDNIHRVEFGVAQGDSFEIFNVRQDERQQDDDDKYDTEIGTDDNDKASKRPLNETAHDITDRASQIPQSFQSTLKRNISQMKTEWEAFQEFVRPHRTSMRRYIKYLFTFIVAPSIFMAGLLFYFAGNPPTGRNGDYMQYGVTKNTPSISWWILFIGVRHPLICSLAVGSEFVLINFFGVSSRRFLKFAGPYTSLLISQSKGFPCILFFHGLYSIFLLHGNYPFMRHWAFWQSLISLFNESNPAGDVTQRKLYERVLITFMLGGIIISLRRMFVGLKFGQRLFERYNKQLTDVMEKMVLLSEIASLTEFTEHAQQLITNLSVDSGSPSRTDGGIGDPTETADPRTKNVFGESLWDDPTYLTNLLDEWEEPIKVAQHTVGGVDLSDIFEFRQTYLLMQTTHPFSILFGIADTRESCASSAIKVYRRLLRRQKTLRAEHENDDSLDFNLLADIAVLRDGSTDKQKVKKLFHLFRPNKNGKLTSLEFIKSVDAIYRELRILSANIQNSSAIDRAFEKIVNFVFYFLLGLFILAINGVNAWSVFLSLLGSIGMLAFAIGPACSLYLEGILLILVRKPYEIGDRIALSDTGQDTDPSGSRGWLIENIDLFTTTMRYGMTREVATLSNGSIARLRIINMNRSDKAAVMIFLRFGVETPYQKIKIFHKAVEQFVFNRPREWVKAFAFRATRVESDLGFVEYVAVLQHRESWQNVATILESRATVSSFCLELQKQLSMRYHSPPMPIDLNLPQETRHSNNVQNLLKQTIDRSRENEVSVRLSSQNNGTTRNDNFDDSNLLRRLSDVGNVSLSALGHEEILAASRLFETKKDK